MKRLLTVLLIAGVAAGTLALYASLAAEEAYPPTAPGQIEVKTVPAATLLRAQSEDDADYYARANGLFMPLFRYIEARDIPMTTPVEAEMEPAAMLFYVDPESARRELESTDKVTVETVPARQVLAVGIRGAYKEKAFEAALEKAEDWLARQTDYEPAGEPRMVFWNSPFVLDPFKRSELHVPLRPKE